MKATVYCPGPSLADYQLGQQQGSKPALVVNRAILKVPEADYWFFLDIGLWGELGGYWQGLECKPVIVTSKETGQAIKRIYGVAVPFLDVDQARGQLPDVQPWFTFPAALLWLWHSQGASEVDVWGCDWVDAADFDGGLPSGANRSNERWMLERKLYKYVENQTGLIIRRWK